MKVHMKVCEALRTDGRKGGHDLVPDFSLKSNPISHQAVVTPRPWTLRERRT